MLEERPTLKAELQVLAERGEWRAFKQRMLELLKEAKTESTEPWVDEAEENPLRWSDENPLPEEMSPLPK
jgi:hypothetical protein